MRDVQTGRGNSTDVKWHAEGGLLATPGGVGTMVWIRWFRFPPLIVAYNAILRREQYLAQKKYASAESTIRTKTKGRARPKSKPKKKKRR